MPGKDFDHVKVTLLHSKLTKARVLYRRGYPPKEQHHRKELVTCETNVEEVTNCTVFDDVRKANASHRDIEEIIEEQPSLVKVAATIIRSTDTEAQAETLIRALSTNPKKAPKVARQWHCTGLCRLL